MNIFHLVFRHKMCIEIVKEEYSTLKTRVTLSILIAFAISVIDKKKQQQQLNKNKQQRYHTNTKITH